MSVSKLAIGSDDCCPVCLDVYNEPKLLPCRHTFCRVCLEKHRKSSKHQDKRQLVCPLCRTKIDLTPKGIPGFHTNYFVGDHGVTNYKQSSTTEVSQDKETAPDSGGTTFVDDLEEDGEGSDENRRIDEQQWTTPRDLRFPRDHTKTHYHFDLLSSTVIDEARSISCLCSTPSGHCLVVADCSNVINKMLPSGQIVDQYIVMPRVNIHDITHRQEGSLLLLATEISEILSYRTVTNTYSTFTTLIDFRGSEMACLDDDRLVVAGVNTSGSSSIRNEYGQLLLFSSHGTIIKRIGDEYMNFQPACVSINTFKNRICFTDVDRRLVSLLTDTGLRIGDFKGRSNDQVTLRSILGDNWPQSSLKPAGLCCDAEGNIIVVEEATSTIFVLDHDGLFRGFVVLEEDREALYSPFLVACGPSGVLWVGDKLQGKVNVYRTSNYINVLDRR
ncbi:uncharacterized protein LOC110451391 [Mizuhopecten yessoensis]|uniref:RING finger protein nhl-1 n=1 Tax=Mizuhopecten yessoensis TaxID=6573 RepID=A0A210QLX6_MIZYE|nr:uncharacterized protein LOC110451391 [Mizuhopecten yessoensis]OWF49701.1 RING finger protein nhl-1 [Mizuhopecten yessoensis]